MWLFQQWTCNQAFKSTTTLSPVSQLCAFVPVMSSRSAFCGVLSTKLLFPLKASHENTASEKFPYLSLIRSSSVSSLGLNVLLLCQIYLALMVYKTCFSFRSDLEAKAHVYSFCISIDNVVPGKQQVLSKCGVVLDSFIIIALSAGVIWWIEWEPRRRKGLEQILLWWLVGGWGWEDRCCQGRHLPVWVWTEMLANVRIEAGTMVVVDRALGIEGFYRMTRQRDAVWESGGPTRWWPYWKLNSRSW